MSGIAAARPSSLPSLDVPSISSPPFPSSVSPSSISTLPSSISSPSPLPASVPVPDQTPATAPVAAPTPLRVVVPVQRRNEHLAVLLPKHLWKADSRASLCENVYCRVRFSLFERRHHCRKCGGVFCGACSSRTTTLLDTSNLAFIHPPRNIPIAHFASPTSPIHLSRVCDDCYDQVHGCPTTPRTPDLVRPTFSRAFSSPISMLKSPLSAPPSGDSSLSSSVATPPTETLTLAAPLARRPRSLRTHPSNSSLASARRHTLNIRSTHAPLPDLDSERSYGELDAYPLKRSSILCKASGGGRWEPKQSPVLAGYRVPVPGGKAPFELEMERQEQQDRARRANPVVRDGEFQYRFPREPEPIIIGRSPLHLSTF